jgi:hypothetical protein
MKKTSDIRNLRMIKIVQISLLVFNVLFFVWEQPYIGALLLLIAAGLELLVPSEYSWGGRAKKSVFFKGLSGIWENLLLLVITALIAVIMANFI